jgi:hypothetical protein
LKNRSWEEAVVDAEGEYIEIRYRDAANSGINKISNDALNES